MTRPLLHPRMAEKLANHYPQICTLKPPIKAQNTVGQEKLTYPAAYPGYESIPCRVGAAGGGQRRGNEQVYLEATHRIVLLGSYPEAAEQWAAEVDSVEYEILFVARSVEDMTTRLECRIVR